MACEHPAARLKAEGQEWNEKCVAGHACDTWISWYIERGNREEWRLYKEKTVRGQRESTSKFIAAMNDYSCAGKHIDHPRKMLPMVVSHFREKTIATSRRTA